MNKRGLSSAIEIILLVLLVLAAFIIVWAFFRLVLSNTGSSIRLQQKCFEVEVKPISCGVGPTPDLVRVRVENVRGNFSKMVAILEGTDGSTFVQEQPPVNEFEIQNFDFPSGNFAYGTSANLTYAAARVTDAESGRSLICPPSLIKVACK